jgi:hypothetical protein
VGHSLKYTVEIAGRAEVPQYADSDLRGLTLPDDLYLPVRDVLRFHVRGAYRNLASTIAAAPITGQTRAKNGNTHIGTLREADTADAASPA